MAVKSGYKQTEFGLIPETWSVQALGELGEPLIGLTYRPENVAEDGILVLRSSNIADGQLRFQDNVFVDIAVPQKIVVREGDILICVRNGSRDLIGKCALVDKRAAGMTFGAFMSVLRTPHSQLIYHMFQSELIKRQIQEHLGATINQITNSSLRSFRIPFPDTEAERTAIAQTLADVDALIRKLDQLIEKKRDLKQSALQQLLSGEKRLPNFGEAQERRRVTSVGLVPTNWEIRTIGELATIATGSTPPTRNPGNYGDEFLFVSPSDLGKGSIIRDTEKKLSMAGFSLSRKFPAGSILFTCIGSTIGKCGIASVELTSNQQINAVLPAPGFSTAFVYHSLCTLAPKIKALAGEQAVPIVNKKQFSETFLLIPPLDEQRAIAKVLTDMDTEIEALEQQRDKTRLLKQGMMQELLTGRTRLV